MKWIEYDYVCNGNKGIVYHKKLEYNETNLAIARQEAVGGNYTITEDDKTQGVQPMSIALGGTNAKTAEEACKNIGGINTYVHGSNGLTGMGANGKFKATSGGTVTSIKVNGNLCFVRCGDETSVDLVAGCWYIFVLDGNVVNFSSGGAGGMNFKVVDGTTKPVSPRENMIWINTKEIAGYYFSAEQPENMQPNEVWISTGVASNAAFNASKKNTIMIYPISAKQMVNGSLVDVKAQSYQNGKWVDWAVFMFKDGKDITDVTGGWVGYAATPLQYPVTPAVEIADGQLHIYYTGMGTGGTGIGATKKMVDLSNANTLHFVVDSISDYINAKVGVWTISGTGATLVRGNDDVTAAGDIVVDVKDLSGSYYVGAMIGRKYGEGRVDIYFSEIRYE